MTESHPLPFDPDAPPAPSRTFGGLTLRHTPAGPAWMAPDPRPAPAADWEDIGAGLVFPAALFYRDAAIAANAVFPAEEGDA